MEGPETLYRSFMNEGRRHCCMPTRSQRRESESQRRERENCLGLKVLLHDCNICICNYKLRKRNDSRLVPFGLSLLSFSSCVMLLHTYLCLFQLTHPAAHAFWPKSQLLMPLSFYASKVLVKALNSVILRSVAVVRISLERISLVNFSPSFVVHIFSSSTVSNPISCFVKCSCFFHSHCRYAEA